MSSDRSPAPPATPGMRDTPAPMPLLHTVGRGLPLALIRACGLQPQALDLAAPAAPGGAGATAVRQPRSVPALLRAIAAAAPGPLLVRCDDPLGAAVFNALREALRHGELQARPVHVLDLPAGDDEPARRYRRRQAAALAAWAATMGGREADDAALQRAWADEARRLDALDALDRLRSATPPALRAGRWREAVHAALLQPLEGHLAALRALRARAAADAAPGARRGPAPRPTRIWLAGARHADAALLASLEARGLQIVGDDLLADPAARDAAWREQPWTGASVLPDLPPDPLVRARHSVEQARERAAVAVHHVAPAGDESEPWFRRWLREACAQAGLGFVAIDLPAEPDEPNEAGEAAGAAEASDPDEPNETDLPARLHRPAAAPPADTASRAAAAAAPEPADGRSRKSLALVAEFSRYQRDWFQTMRRRAHDGEPFSVLNADAPQELLRAFDLPFVVNQWWASIVAAKQHSARYLQRLREHGYPTDAEPYSAQGLAAGLDPADEDAPWGGLPTPGLLMAVNGTAATAGIFRSWAAQASARLVLFDRTAEKRVDVFENWWDRLPVDWDRALEPDRLDLLESQLVRAIATLEAFSGRRFDEARLHEVMALVNEQEEHYRRTRDLIAQAAQAPVSVVDTMPAVMVPQWHRGTRWGVQAAQALHDEVRRRVQQQQAACPGERLRLMWVGRGLWSRMGFYQQWEASHGAVFVWSMYLGLAADGYLRRPAPGRSPLRALASRFVTMGDELRMPTWAGAWHVKEARLHRADAAVAVDDADPLVLAALQRAGLPVLRLALGNFGASADALAQAGASVGRFLDTLRVQRKE